MWKYILRGHCTLSCGDCFLADFLPPVAKQKGQTKWCVRHLSTREFPSSCFPDMAWQRSNYEAFKICLMGGGMLAASPNQPLPLPLTVSIEVSHTHPHTVTSSHQETINPIGGKDGVSFIVQFSSVEPGTTVVLGNIDCWGNGFVVKRLGFPWSRPLCLFIFSSFLAPDCFWLNTLFPGSIVFCLKLKVVLIFPAGGDSAPYVACIHTLLLCISEKSTSNTFFRC